MSGENRKLKKLKKAKKSKKSKKEKSEKSRDKKSTKVSVSAKSVKAETATDMAADPQFFVTMKPTSSKAPKRGRSRSPTTFPTDERNLNQVVKAPKPPKTTGIDALDLLNAMEAEAKAKSKNLN